MTKLSQTLRAHLRERLKDPNVSVEEVQEAVDLLARFAELGAPECKAVDVSGLLDELLEAWLDKIQTRRLLVLRELDRARGVAHADAAQLRFAFDALLGKVLELVPERGDIYLASEHHEDGLRGRPALRVLMRFESSDAIAPANEVDGLSLAELPLELVLADVVVRSQGGTMTASTADSRETVIRIDLPA